MTNAITVAGDIQISTGAQLNAAAAGNTITLNGNWINNSTNAAPFNPSTSTVLFNGGTNTISGSGITSFNNVTINAISILTSNSSIGKVLVLGNWVNEGDFNHNISDITFDGTTIISGASFTTFNTAIVNAAKTLTLHATQTDFDKDITSNGTLNHNNGLVVFTGIGSTQNVNGTSASFILSAVTVDNLSGNVLLGKPLTINGALTLTTGNITTTATNILTLIAGASATGASSSFINGPVKKIGSTAFTFPVGKTTVYAPLTISAPSVVTDAFTAEYLRASGTALGGITASGLTQVSKCEYWSLDRTTGTSTVNLTLSWSASSPCGAGAYITDLGTLTVAHFGTSWDTHGSNGTTGNTTAGTITRNAVSVFSPFTLGSTSILTNPLPVKLLSFTATSNNQHIILKWTTASESNNLYFEIERSINGTQYEPIGRVAGIGTTSQTTHYNFTDLTPSATNYYRLKQVDIDGRYEYSTILTIKLNSELKKGVNIFPNPVSNKINISISSDLATNADIKIIDALGQLIYYQKEKLAKGVNVITINSLFNLSKGIYTLQVVMDNEIFSTKFISTR